MTDARNDSEKEIGQEPEKESGQRSEKDPGKDPSPASGKPAESRRAGTGAKVKKGTDAVRSRIASVVWLAAVVCALILAAGALLIALKANQDNAAVKVVLDAADALDLDVFSRDNGIFTPSHDPDGTKSALINWGIAALAYLVVGKVADRIIRP